MLVEQRKRRPLERFPSLDITDIYIPNEKERELVNEALGCFAPISTTYSNYQLNDDILETYFGMKSTKSEWERVEILLNGGLANASGGGQHFVTTNGCATLS